MGMLAFHNLQNNETILMHAKRSKIDDKDDDG